MPETIKLLGRTKNKIIQDKNVSYLEIIAILLKNECQHDSRVLHTFIPNKSLGELLDISPKSFIFHKIFNLEFSFTEVWFTDQNSKLPQIKDINILVINTQHTKSDT